MSTVSKFEDYEELLERYHQFAHERAKLKDLTVDICSTCGVRDVCPYRIEHCPFDS